MKYKKLKYLLFISLMVNNFFGFSKVGDQKVHTLISDSISNSFTYSKFSIGLSFTPKYAFRTSEFIADENDVYYDIYKYMFEQLNDVESYKYTLDFGILIEYQINKNFIIRSGISYINNGEKQDYYEGQGADSTAYKIYNSYTFLSLPVIVKFKKEIKKWRFNIMTGFSVNCFLNKKGVFKPHLDDYFEIYPGLFRKRYKKIDAASVPDWNFEFIAGLAIEYKLNEKTSLSLEPIYRRDLKPIYFENGMEIKEFHYSYGISIVCLRKF